jgi:hypothetical protein
MRCESLACYIALQFLLFYRLRIEQLRRMSLHIELVSSLPSQSEFPLCLAQCGLVPVLDIIHVKVRSAEAAAPTDDYHQAPIAMSTLMRMLRRDEFSAAERHAVTYWTKQIIGVVLGAWFGVTGATGWRYFAIFAAVCYWGGSVMFNGVLKAAAGEKEEDREDAVQEMAGYTQGLGCMLLFWVFFYTVVGMPDESFVGGDVPSEVKGLSS